MVDTASDFTGRYIRIVAILALFLGLSDAARLLGVTLGTASPLTALGPVGFTLLGVFCLSRLFAAVGLWIRASWGAVLLVGATSAEIVLYLAGSGDVDLSLIGLVMRVILLVALVAIFALGLRLRRRAQD